MNAFWENSPLWQREHLLAVDLEKAEKARDRGGEDILICVRVGGLDAEIGRQKHAEYLAAYEAWEDAYVAWDKARKAFESSRVGRAYFQYLHDPLNRSAAFFAPEAAPALEAAE